MSSYAWASPTKAYEYYLDRAGRTQADLWAAVYDGHIRVRIMDVEFPAPQVRALLQLQQYFNVTEQQREYLPIGFMVNVDDVERVLCGESVPDNSRGRPHKTRDQVNRDHRIAVEVSILLGRGEVNSVAEAARELIAAGRVEGNSYEAKLKKVQRAYARFFRHD